MRPAAQLTLVAGGMLWALTACSSGPNEATLLDELRIISTVVEPPEVGPGESVQVQSTVVDPEQAGYELLVWACTPTGDGCLEDALPLDQRLALPGDDPATFAVPAVPLPEDSELPLLLWSLACEPNLCPVIDDARAALASEGELPPALRNPYDMLQALPLLGVSLASRTLTVSDRPEAERNHNPVLTVDEAPPDRLAPEAEAVFTVRIDDDTDEDELLTLGLTTAGGFSSPFYAVDQGEAELTYFAPADPDDALLFILVEDGLGGSALWTGQTQVAE